MLWQTSGNIGILHCCMGIYTYPSVLESPIDSMKHWSFPKDMVGVISCSGEIWLICIYHACAKWHLFPESYIWSDSISHLCISGVIDGTFSEHLLEGQLYQSCTISGPTFRYIPHPEAIKCQWLQSLGIIITTVLSCVECVYSIP